MDFWCKKGHFNTDQAIFVKNLIDKHQPKYCLETGFCTGRSTSTVLINSKFLLKMISIDINFDYIKPEGRQYQKLLLDKFPNFHTIEKSSRIVLDDAFFKKQFPNGIDWFTVDGDHSYEGCLFDLNAVYPYMNKNGIIIIDDYKSGPPNGCTIQSVTDACNDFHKTHSSLKKEEWNDKGKGFCIFKF